MKKTKLITFFTTITVTIVAAFSATVAWFNTTLRFGDATADVTGYSDGAYYDYGSGTADDPYGIRTPRHLYNLAWLQYLGQYNKINENTNKREQFYFELADNVDMTGWTLPPIGTSTYPFIGEFNGNGFTVSNATVSNLFNDYERTPDVVTSVTGVDIIGLFGVVGSLSTSVTEDNKASVSLADAYGTAPYNSQVNQIINLGIENATISSQTNKTLIGVAAGYVNGTLDGVAVSDSNISISSNTSQAYNTTLTENYSDYSLIGYATNYFKGEIEEKEIKVETPEAEYTNVSASGDNWGNSINFLDAYNRLLREKNVNGTTFTKTYNSGSLYDVDGTTLISQGRAVTVSKHKLSSGFSSEFTITNSKVNDNESHQVASYTFYDRTKDGGGDYDNYMYMFGKYDFSLPNNDYKLTEASNFEVDKEYLFSDGNNHFMVVNNGNLANASKTNIMDYSGFILDSDGYLISESNGTTYYLRSNGNTLQLDTNNNYADNWTYDPTNQVVYTQYSNNTYFIYYDGTRWTNIGIADTTVWGATSQVKIRFNYEGTTYYLIRNSNGTLGTTTNVDEGLVFNKNTNGRYSTTIGSTTYYLGAVASGNNFTAGVYASGTNNLNYFTENDGFLRFTSGNRTYYLKYNNGFTVARNANGGVITISELGTMNPSFDSSQYKVQLYELEDITAGKTYDYSSDVTYFPLSFTSNSNSDSDYNTVSENNTGYIVSGANYTTQPGDLRISKYARTNLYVSLNGTQNNASYNSAGSNLNLVTRTANSNGFVLIKDDYNKNNTSVSSTLTNQFGNASSRKWYDNQTGGLNLQKYKDSREHLHTLMQESNIYGLHFMDAQISSSHKITIPYAKINRNVFNDYELPEDCIDFNLKRKGYINFFAGTYFSGNTTFFSLYHIVRNEDNQINSSSIKEISKIYINKGTNTDLYPYIYLYANNDGYNVEVSGSSDARLGDMVFDMSWVTTPTMVNYAMYYFEIPANAGEYALGSVRNKNGAYLMYLDIGASSKSTDVTTVTERITTIVETFDYVIGIDFVSNMPKKKEDFETIDGGDSAHVSIPTGSTGTLNYKCDNDANDENKKTLTLSAGEGASFTGNLASTYASIDTTIYNSITSSELNVSAKETHTTILDKITTYGFNSQTLNLVTTIATRETVDGVAGLWTEDEPIYEDAESTYQSSLELDNTGDVIFIFEYSAPKSAQVTVTSFYNPDTSAYYFTITSTVNIRIHITKLVSTYNYLNDHGVQKTVNYTYYVNSEDQTVAEGDYINITASS